MASNNAWPVVQPLPKILVQFGLIVFFVLGHLVLWNDRRVGKAADDVQKPLGVPAFK